MGTSNMKRKFKEISTEQVERPSRYVNRFFIHCSATDNEGPAYEGAKLAESVDRWHRERGWSGIGYHFVIDKEGVLVTGRDIELTPAAQGRYNRHTLAVMLHGLEKDKFTQVQLATLKKLCKRLDTLYNNSKRLPPKLTFHGHCEVSAKSCPVIDYKSLLKLDNAGNLGI